MQTVTTILTPILVGVAMLLIPICTNFIVRAISRKLDEGRARADERADKTERLLMDYQRENDRVANERHMENQGAIAAVLEQATLTNGKVADLTMRMTKEEAKTELLTEMVLGRQPDKGS